MFQRHVTGTNGSPATESSFRLGLHGMCRVRCTKKEVLLVPLISHSLWVRRTGLPLWSADFPTKECSYMLRFLVDKRSPPT